MSETIITGQKDQIKRSFSVFNFLLKYSIHTEKYTYVYCVQFYGFSEIHEHNQHPDNKTEYCQNPRIPSHNPFQAILCPPQCCILNISNIKCNLLCLDPNVIHQYCCMWLYTVNSHCYKALRWMTIPQYIHSFYYWWAFEQFPVWGYYQECCCEHSSQIFWWTHVHIIAGHIPGSRTGGFPGFQEVELLGPFPPPWNKRYAS